MFSLPLQTYSYCLEECQVDLASGLTSGLNISAMHRIWKYTIAMGRGKFFIRVDVVVVGVRGGGGGGGGGVCVCVGGGVIPSVFVRAHVRKSPAVP